MCQVCSVVTDVQCAVVEVEQCGPVAEQVCSLVEAGQECKTVDEFRCNVVEEEFCREVERPVCRTQSELQCGNVAVPKFDPAAIPLAQFDGTGELEPRSGQSVRQGQISMRFCMIR